jgi:hypothetical protein
MEILQDDSSHQQNIELRMDEPFISSDEVVGLFNWPNPSSRTMTLVLTQPLIEISTKNLPGGKRRPARKADPLPPSVSRLSRETVGASTSHNPMVLHGLLQG